MLIVSSNPLFVDALDVSPYTTPPTGTIHIPNSTILDYADSCPVSSTSKRSYVVFRMSPWSIWFILLLPISSVIGSHSSMTGQCKQELHIPGVYSCLPTQSKGMEYVGWLFLYTTCTLVNQDHDHTCQSYIKLAELVSGSWGIITVDCSAQVGMSTV